MKTLVLRYANNIVPDCIEQHIKVFEETGYCWFGKLGKAPGEKILTQIVSKEAKDNIILYMRGKAFLCSCDEYSLKKPLEGYPLYYDTEFGRFGFSDPSIYFRLYGIKEIDLKKYKYVVSSSKNALQDTLNKSMNSFFVAEKGDPAKDKNLRGKEVNKEILSTETNDCVYKKEKKCTLKSFVNYGYICERPQSCVRQKKK